MGKSQQPYPAVVPYLVIRNAAKFIDFTEMVFDARLETKQMRDETLIMHGEVRIRDSVIMFADATEQWPEQPCSLFITVADADGVFQKALDHGAIIVQDLTSQDYGRGGGVRDPFGNIWWITAPQEQ